MKKTKREHNNKLKNKKTIRTTKAKSTQSNQQIRKQLKQNNTRA